MFATNVTQIPTEAENGRADVSGYESSLTRDDRLTMRQASSLAKPEEVLRQPWPTVRPEWLDGHNAPSVGAPTA